MIPVDLSANCEGWIYDPNGSGIQIFGIGSRDPFSGSTDMSAYNHELQNASYYNTSTLCCQTPCASQSQTAVLPDAVVTIGLFLLPDAVVTTGPFLLPDAVVTTGPFLLPDAVVTTGPFLLPDAVVTTGPFLFAGAAVLLTAEMCYAVGHCFRRRRLLSFVGGVNFILAGQCCVGVSPVHCPVQSPAPGWPPNPCSLRLLLLFSVLLSPTLSYVYRLLSRPLSAVSSLV